ncbi:hypothetical protein TCAL_09473 [Tigriopus californicus]|uniref:G-protein coupled receptors family 1 profile domain-containing protein n=1 Tax=Tigriopus californicus TaxID=6832 RepID=A0A553PKA3_TIGCA|nr:FMRFamide receptor-like [Tigriopus californicus]TRY78111.1 hypothetical protein TCAL_09473 [Tigriopus californicus]|eukprot:TCALIF_09473-PA protein Name:"Similar to FR FMRFamide receptor (Drosophila melanogaster)" AED:0.24 eAED:0.24 QI:0/-1/0/1/-1/1/1/0/423
MNQTWKIHTVNRSLEVVPMDQEDQANMGEDQIFTYVTEGIILSCVCIFGMVGNFLSLIVMLKSSARAAFSNHLRGLAIFDTFFLFMALLNMGLPKLWPWYREGLFMDLINLLFGLLHTSRVGSVCFTVSVNVDRLCVIVFPLKPCGWKRYLIPLAIIIAVLYDLPRFFEFDVVTNPRSGQKHVFTTALRKNALYVSLYVFWSKFIFFEIIPYVTILICNIFIIVKIRKSQQFRRKFNVTESGGRSNPVQEIQPVGSVARYPLQTVIQTEPHVQTSLMMREVSQKYPKKRFLQKQAEEHHLGIILVGLSSLFIVCQSFKIVPDLYEIYWCSPGEECPMEGISNSVMRLSHLLVCINSAANFLIYYMNGEKFRLAWAETYGCPLRYCWNLRPSKLTQSLRGSFSSIIREQPKRFEDFRQVTSFDV